MFRKEKLEFIASKARKGISHPYALELGCVLNDTYVVGEVLYAGQSGFVYKGVHIHTGQTVVLKEFFPLVEIEVEKESLRFYRNESNQCLDIHDVTVEKLECFDLLKDKFLYETKFLKTLISSYKMLTLRDVFQANATNYLVLDYIDYPTLAELLASDIEITATFSVWLIQELLSSIILMHQMNVIHRDLKPANIFITPTHVIIGDFGIAKRLDSIHLSQTVMFTNGFSAPEQMGNLGAQGTWTDIYAFGKIMAVVFEKMSKAEYTLIPKQIMDIVELAKKETISERFSNAEAMINYLLLFKNESLNKPEKSLPKKSFRLVLVFIMVVSLCVGTFYLGYTAVKEDNVSMTVNDNNLNNIPQFIDMDEFTLRQDETCIIDWLPTRDSSYYKISLLNRNTWVNEIKWLETRQTTLDLTHCALSAAPYTITVTYYNKEREEIGQIFKAFEVQPAQYVGPAIELQENQMSYEMGTDLELSWEALGDVENYEVVVMNLEDGFKEKNRITIDEGHVNLDDLITREGYNLLIITAQNQTGKGIPAKVEVFASGLNQMKFPLIQNPDGFVFQQGKSSVVRWEQSEKAERYEVSFMRLIDQSHPVDTVITTETSLDIGEYKMPWGSYYVDVRYQDEEGQWSPTARRQFNFNAAGLSKVNIIPVEKKSYSTTDVLSLKWEGSRFTHKYKVTLKNRDEQDILNDETTQTTFEYKLDALTAGDYKVFITAYDINEFASEAASFSFTIK